MTSPGVVSTTRWVLACAAAEGIGMAAAATAARIGQDVSSGGASGARWLALAVVIAGGLVEGTALGVLQGAVLARRWPVLRRIGYWMMTLLVAGVGWAAASAPGVLSEDRSGDGPPVALMVLGGLGLGLVMGPILGAAQATALRGVVAHPWRWVDANVAAWPLAMAVIFAGAASTGPDWPTLAVAAYGALTGLLAGAVLGLVTATWLASLDGQSVNNRLALAMVAGRHLGMHRRLVGLAVTGRRTGLVMKFPVRYAAHDGALVVIPRPVEHQHWWRALAVEEAVLWVLDGSGWHTGHGHLLLPGEEAYDAAVHAYHDRWPRFEAAPHQPVVVLRLVGPGIPAVSAGF
jgi:hypothetical protein